MKPDAVWGLWLAVTLVTFAVMETKALASRREDDTLSAALRRWLGIQPHRPWAVAGMAAFVGFLVWLGVHIVTSWV